MVKEKSVEVFLIQISVKLQNNSINYIGLPVAVTCSYNSRGVQNIKNIVFIITQYSVVLYTIYTMYVLYFKTGHILGVILFYILCNTFFPDTMYTCLEMIQLKLCEVKDE